MSIVTLHREVVKAEIRIKHGSIEAFADANNLKSQVVRDLLRGQSAAAKQAVADLLGVDADQLVIVRDSTHVERSSKRKSRPHRLNAGGQ
ncbi:helix-turn-helix domain-containing protein [Sphingomonas aestuarii]